MILALDLATCTGFCHGRGDALPMVGHVRLPVTHDEVGPYLDVFERWIIQKVELVAPELVVFEAPIHRQFDRAIITRKLHALPGVAEMVCWRRGIDVRQVAPTTAKKALTGRGNADKNSMAHHARAYGLTIKVSDEADAFAVWLVAFRIREPAQALRFDTAFRGALVQ